MVLARDGVTQAERDLNRRDFFKLAATFMAATYLPKEFLMPTYNYSGDFYIKLLKDLYRKNGVTIPEADFSTLQRLVDEERARDEAVRSWQRVQDNKIAGDNLELPIKLLFTSGRMEKTYSSITFPVPGNYNHILIFGNGRTTWTGNPAENILLRCNEDSGNNYDIETFYRLNNSSSGGQNLSANAISIGTFATADADANASGNLFGFLPNYGSPFFKGANGIGGGYFTAAAGAITFCDFGTWESVNPVISITLLPEGSPTSGFAAGTTISAYGLI